MDHLSFYLSAATYYAEQASSVFNMFLTVLFSSLGFAAALPLGDFGKTISIFGWKCSSSSLCIGIMLFAFYVISYAAFSEFSGAAGSLLEAIHKLGVSENLPESALSAFPASSARLVGLRISSVGFLVGAFFGLFIFMWLTNVERSKE
jgi:hypothetical protein